MEDKKPKKSVFETINRLNEMLDKEEEIELKKARKKFSMPRKIKSGTKRKLKQNKVLLGIINTNGLLKLDWVKVEDEMVYDKKGKAYRIANSKYLMNFLGKYPMVLVHESSMVPISPEDIWNEIKDKDSVETQRYLIKIMKMTQAELKKGSGGLNNKAIFILVIGGIIVLYLILGGLGLI